MKLPTPSNFPGKYETFVATLAHVCISALLACAYFSPVLLSIREKVPCTYPDVYMFIWNIWESQNQTGFLPKYFTNKTFLPSGASLLLHTWCEGIIWPISRALYSHSPIVLFNVICLGAFFANYMGATFLVGRLTSSFTIVATASAILAYHPFIIGHLQGGHLNFVFVMPLLVLAGLGIESFRNKQSCSRFMLMGLLITWTVFYNLYFTYYIALVTGFGSSVLFFLFKRTRRHILPNFIGPWLLVAVLAGPHLLDVWKLTASKTYTPNHDPTKLGADLAFYLVPSMYQLLGSLSFFENLRSYVAINSAEQGLYVGWVPLLVLLLEFPRTIRTKAGWSLLAPIALFVCLSFGYQITLGHYSLGTPLLYPAFYEVLPAFPSVPIRFGFVVVLFISGIAVWRIGSLSKSAQYALLALWVLELCPVHPPTLSIPMTPGLEAVKRLQISRLVDLDGINELPLIRQVFHNHPIVGGYLARRPRSYERLLSRNKFIRFVRNGSVESTEKVLSSFRELGADGVLVKTASRSERERLESLEWLEQVVSDPYITFFVFKSPDR